MPNTIITSAMEKHRQAAILLYRPYPPTSFPQTKSFLGGLPQLPEHAPWPRTDGGVPLHFLAQIDCASLPDHENELPDSGLLLFFARIDDGMLWGEGENSAHNDCRVIFVADGIPETPATTPNDLPSIQGGWSGYEKNFLLPDEPPFRIYPKWPVMCALIESWPDASALTSAEKQNLDTEEYQKTVQDARVLEATKATNIPIGTPVASDWAEIGPGGFLRGPAALPYYPEFVLPHVWVMAERISRRFANRLEEFSKSRADKKKYLEKKGAPKENWAKKIVTGFASQKQHSEEIDRLAEEIQRTQSIRSEAISWVHYSTGKGLDNKPEDADANRFTSWLEKISDGTNIHIRGYLKESIVEGFRSTIRYCANSPEAAKLISPLLYEHLSIEHTPISATLVSNEPPVEHFHQMFGQTASSQKAMIPDSDNLLLLQLKSDSGVEFMFCDVGEVEFRISADDLAARRFENVWATTCGH